MLKSNWVVIVILLASISAKAQNVFAEKRMEGRVYSRDGDVAATHVLNTTTKKATITDANGNFSINAKLNDTLVFSAVQYKRKEILVTLSLLESKFFTVPLEESVTELDEVVLMPYNLTGDMSRDADRLHTATVVTASTLGLPNAYVKPVTKAERELFAATSNPFMSFDPLINAITGRTKRLNNLVKVEKRYARTIRVREFYLDSLITADLGIPQEKISDFMYYCEVDPNFQALVDTHDRLKIWEYMTNRSMLYRQNNSLD
ncbi:MAG: carboxypeptidase-like regulatory domain-containing protein [Flavobacteriaceae bacterium]